MIKRILSVFLLLASFGANSAGEYYLHGSFPSPGSVASSSAMRAEFDTIQAGFDKLPALSGNGSKIVAVNSGGTALEALTTTGTGNGVRATSPTLTTPTLSSATLTTPTINTAASVGGTWTAASTWTLPALTASAGITMSGTASNLGLGANYVSYGGTDAGLSLDSSNNATLSGTLKIGNGGSSFFLGIQDDSYYMRIHGSNAVNQGAGLILFGGTHATLPNVGRLTYGSTTALEWSSSGITSSLSLKSSSASAGIGYATGAGSAATQTSSRTNSVTLNAVTGAITLVSAAGSTTPASFTLTNSSIAATDVLIVNQKSGTDKYLISVTAVAAGSAQITFYTTGGTTTEQPVFNFAVIKGVAS